MACVNPMLNHPPKVVLDTKEIIVLQAQLGEWDNLNHLLICKKTKDAVIIGLMVNIGMMYAIKMAGV